MLRNRSALSSSSRAKKNLGEESLASLVCLSLSLQLLYGAHHKYMLNASGKRQCWLSRHSRRHLASCSRARHRVMMTSRASLRQRHSLPTANSFDAESPTSEPSLTLRCPLVYSDLTGLMDVLRTPAGTAAAAARQRNFTFSYERLMSRTSVTAADCSGADVDYDDIVDADNETRLATTVNRVSPLLTANIAVLSDVGASVEEKCVALDELLYLVEGAWSMPIIGREVAYRVCDVLREQNGLDVLLSNINGRTSDAADTQTEEIIVLMSAIVLSQV